MESVWRDDSLVLGVKYKNALSESTLSFQAHIHATSTYYMPSTVSRALGVGGCTEGGQNSRMEFTFCQEGQAVMESHRFKMVTR